MRENQLPVHCTSAEETGRIQPAVDSSDGGVHITRERVTHVEARPAGNYLADDLSNSVQITLTKRVVKPGSDKVMCLTAQTSIPIPDDEISSVSNLGLKLADGTKVALSLTFFNDEAAQNVTPMRGAEPPTHFSCAGGATATADAADADRALPVLRNQYVDHDPEPYIEEEEEEETLDFKLGRWLLAAAVISVTTLYTICNPKWVPCFVAQTANISKQLSADIKRRASTPLGGTAVTETAKAGAGAAGIHGAPTARNSASAVQPKDETAICGVARNSVVRGVSPAAPASLRDVDPSAAQHYGSSSGAHRTIASDRDETGRRENSRRHTHNGNHTARSNAGYSGSGGGMLLVPPPPPTPCVLPPGFGFFPMQQSQQYGAPQQQLQEIEAQASPRTHNQAAARENTPQQSSAASGRTEAIQSAALVGADKELQAADQELQAALRSSLITADKWTR